MSKIVKLTIKERKPICRTPIKPMETHKNYVKYVRKDKYNKQIEFG